MQFAQSVKFLVSEVPVPVPGMLDVSFTLPPCGGTETCSNAQGCCHSHRFSLGRGGGTQLPLLPFGNGRCLGMLLAAFGPEGVVRLVECALCEAQIVIISQSSESLVPLCEALSTLLYPFVWQHCYVPVLPPQLLECVQAPLAFIVGINSCWREELADVLSSNTIVVADADQGTIRSPPDVPTLPDEHRASVLHVLQGVAGEKVACKPKRASQDVALFSEADELDVRRAFLRCYGLLLSGYAECLFFFKSAPVFDQRRFLLRQHHGSTCLKADLGSIEEDEEQFLSTLFTTSAFTAFLEAHVVQPDSLQPFTAEMEATLGSQRADGASSLNAELDDNILLFKVPHSRAASEGGCDSFSREGILPNSAQSSMTVPNGAIRLACLRPLVHATPDHVRRWNVVEAAQQLGLSGGDVWRLLEAQRILVRSVITPSTASSPSEGEGAGSWALASPMSTPRASHIHPAVPDDGSVESAGAHGGTAAVALAPLAKCAARLPSRIEEAAERILYDVLARIFSSQTVASAELQRCADACFGYGVGNHCRRLLATSLCRPERLGTPSFPERARAHGSQSARFMRRRSSWSAHTGDGDMAAATPPRPYTPLGTSHSRGSCLCHRSFDSLAFLCAAALHSCFEAGQAADLPSAHALIRGGAWNFYIMHKDGRREFLAERLRGARCAGSLALWQLALREALVTARFGRTRMNNCTKADTSNIEETEITSNENGEEVVFEQAGSLVSEMLGLGVGVDQARAFVSHACATEGLSASHAATLHQLVGNLDRALSLSREGTPIAASVADATELHSTPCGHDPILPSTRRSSQGRRFSASAAVEAHSMGADTFGLRSTEKSQPPATSTTETGLAGVACAAKHALRRNSFSSWRQGSGKEEHGSDSAVSPMNAATLTSQASQPRCQASASHRTVECDVSCSSDVAVQMNSRAHKIHTGAVLCIALCGQTDSRLASVAGQCLVSGGADHRVAVTFPTGTSKTLGHHRGAVSCIVAGIQCNGLLVSGSHDRELRVWDVGALRTPAKTVGDKRRLPMLLQRRKASHDVAKADPLVTVLCGHTGSILALAALPSVVRGDASVGGAVVSAAQDGTLRCWDIGAATCTAVLEHGVAPVTCCACFSPDAEPSGGEGTLCSGSRDGTVCLWDVASERLVQRFAGHSDWVMDVKMGLSNDQLLLSASRDGNVRIWDARSAQPCVAVCTGHGAQVNCVVGGIGSVGTQLGSASDDTSVRLWDLRGGGTCCAVFRGHSASVTGLVGYWGQLVSSSDDATMKMWDVGGGDCLRTYYGHCDAVSCLATDGTALVSGSWDSVVRAWA